MLEALRNPMSDAVEARHIPMTEFVDLRNMQLMLSLQKQGIIDRCYCVNCKNRNDDKSCLKFMSKLILLGFLDEKVCKL